MVWLQRLQQLQVPYGRSMAGMALAIAAIAAAAPSALAQTLLQEDGTLAPMETRYTFTGQAGQTVAIRLASEEFDPILALLGPDGNELATNDDSERTLNSRIVETLPRDGTYTIVARSFSGGGGNFKLTVTPATEVDRATSRAEMLIYEGNFNEALTWLNRAIASSPDQPLLYWYRADAYLSLDQQAKAVEDYTRARDLYEQAGDTTNSATMADMINSFSQTY